MVLGRKVSGAHLGIVGLGRIGKAIAKRAQGFGMSIAYTARTEKPNSGFQFFPPQRRWLHRWIFWWSSPLAAHAPNT
jgi:lactate dehydrogenase-like 2-hydroxyacid dehydrogenase